MLFASMILAAWLLAACGASTQGPTTWIDRPLDGTHFPLASITIQAHASDADGIGSIEFYVSESLIASIPAGGGRLGKASIDWMPPASDTYTLIARAIDNQGNFGPPATVQIVVDAASPITGTTTPTPASSQCAAGDLVAPVLLSPSDGATVGPEPVLAWSYPNNNCHPHSYRIDVSENASFSDVSSGFGTQDYNETSRQWPLPSGKCYYWRALAYVPDTNGPASPSWRFCIAEKVTGPSLTLTKNANCREGPGTAYDTDDTLFEGQTVLIDGRNQESSWFWVKKPSGSGHCWVSVVTGQIVGDINAVQIVSAEPLPQPQPQPNEPPQPQQPADTTPPAISNVSIDPTTLQKAGCGSPNTFTIIATVTDNSGVGNVSYEIRGPGPADGGNGYLLPAGGNTYQATVGPISGSTGNWSVSLSAVDMDNNSAQTGPWTIQIMCIQ
jgi:hypothetical protein